MNLKEKIGQFFSPAAFIHDTEDNIQAMEALIQKYHIGGITFFHSRHSAAANFESRQERLDYSNTLEKLLEQINRYQKISKTPLLISIDAEYGLAMRIEDTPQYPYAISLGAMSVENVDLIEKVGYRIGKDLKSCGIHLNFAPVADINSNPNNPVIGYRSFGTDKEKVSKFALAMYKGMEKAGIGACYKHFPGHGDTDVDSHLGLPVLHRSKRELIEEELYPFIKGIQSGIDMIMVGHLAVPTLSAGKNIPATISSEVITDFLKNELGFEGIVVSDALNMKSVSDMFPEPGRLEWEAFRAGNDLLCFSENVGAGIEMISKKGDISQIEGSFARIIALKEKLGVKSTKLPLQVHFDWESHEELNAKLASHYISTISKNKDTDIFNCRSFAKVSVFAPLFNPFFAEVDNQHNTPSFEINSINDLAWEDVKQFENLLIALYIPSVKPVNNFGLDLEVMNGLGELLLTKNCQLYVFGNPLALKWLPNQSHAVKITCAFQDFEAVQKKAGLDFLEEMDADGNFQL